VRPYGSTDLQAAVDEVANDAGAGFAGRTEHECEEVSLVHGDLVALVEIHFDCRVDLSASRFQLRDEHRHKH